MRIFKLKQQRGIGLLELMLSLGIIAVMLIMATKYYNSTKVQSNVNTAVQNIQAAYAACEASLNDAPDGTLCKNTDTLSKNGYLPVGFAGDATSENPWGGTFTIDYSGSPRTVNISVKDVPDVDCNILVNRLQQTLVTSTSKITSPEMLSCTGDPAVCEPVSTPCKSGTQAVSISY